MGRDLVKRAIENIPSSWRNSTAALSVILKDAILARYQERRGSHKPTAKEDLIAKLAEIAFAFDAKTINALGLEAGLPDVEFEDLGQVYFRRVAEQASEYLCGVPVCPELLIEVQPSAPKNVNPNGFPVHAVLFEWFPGFNNEFYALAVDSYSADLDFHGRPKKMLVGAHRSWLCESGRLMRCIRWTGPDDDLLIETSFHKPLVIHSAQTICSSIKAHREFDQWCSTNSVFQLNPFSASSIADDKFVCFERWKQAGVATPDSILIKASSSEKDILSLLADFVRRLGDEARIVVQPNLGTEGQGVEVFDAAADMDTAVKYCVQLATSCDVVVREVRGNVFYEDENTGERCACDLRVNVSFDGKEYRAESGYFQVASSGASFSSSVGRGGRVVSFRKDPWKSLVDASGRPVRIGAEALEDLKKTACEAAKALGGLWQVGIDLKLEIDEDGQVHGVVLDANPRPAGLTHSYSFARYAVESYPCVFPHVWIGLDEIGT